MDETHELIGLARDAAEEVVKLSSGLLRSGADITRIHRNYVGAALDHLSEAETQALLSIAGDRAAYEALELLVARLERLLAKSTGVKSSAPEHGRGLRIVGSCPRRPCTDAR